MESELCVHLVATNLQTCFRQASTSFEANPGADNWCHLEDAMKALQQWSFMTPTGQLVGARRLCHEEPIGGWIKDLVIDFDNKKEQLDLKAAAFHAGNQKALKGKKP